MPTVEVVELGAWEAQVRIVPPHASFRWQKCKLEYPPRPARPMITYHSKLTDSDEVVPALPDTAEYNKWLVAVMDWETACGEVRDAAAMAEMEFSFDYAILAWRQDGGDWLTEPPNDWQPSEAYARHDVMLPESRRLQFIFDELLERPKYHDAIRVVAFPGGEQDMAPVTDGEVAAVLQSFPVGDGISQSSRGVGGRSGAGAHSRADVQFSSRDVGGKSKRKRGLLVRLFQGRKGDGGGS